MLLACTHHTVVQLVYQTIDWRSKQTRALPHFTNGHLFCYSFFLTASVPQKENNIFITLSMAMFINLKTGRKKLMPGTPYAVLK